MTTDQTVSSNFSNRLRLRVCGILLTDQGLLMARHAPFGPAGELWIPPGGGMQYAETAEEALIREFKEETHLDVQPGRLLFVSEVMDLPIHAVELFFEIDAYSGKLGVGTDPELSSDKQILKEITFLSESAINQIPTEKLHNIFKYLHNKDGLISFDSLLRLNGKYIS